MGTTSAIDQTGCWTGSDNGSGAGSDIGRGSSVGSGNDSTSRTILPMFMAATYPAGGGSTPLEPLGMGLRARNVG